MLSCLHQKKLKWWDSMLRLDWFTKSLCSRASLCLGPWGDGVHDCRVMSVCRLTPCRSWPRKWMGWFDCGSLARTTKGDWVVWKCDCLEALGGTGLHDCLLYLGLGFTARGKFSDWTSPRRCLLTAVGDNCSWHGGCVIRAESIVILRRLQ